jgi:gp6-like head-tail connector protein
MLTTTSVITPPKVEPVSLDMLRLHCRIDHTSDDLLLVVYLQTARMLIEEYLSRPLLTQTLMVTFRPEGRVPHGGHFLRPNTFIPRAPIQSISSVTVLDLNGNLTPIEPAALPTIPPATLLGWIADLNLTPPLLTIGLDTELIDGRTLRQAGLQNLQVTFVAGYGTAATTIPAPIIISILMLAAYLYENRGDVPAEIPQGARGFCDPYRLMLIG